MSMKSSILNVPGASIYHEVRGKGPVLLLIPGGPMDAGVFAPLAQQLEDRYTVVAYDPRGNSRSLFKGEAEELQLDVQADDAALLIESLGGGPAYVFGSSGGAQIGLNLAARHGDRVHAVLAHEPPCLVLLDEPAADIAAAREIHDIYRRDGVEAAMAKFMGEHGLGEDDGQGDGPSEFDADPEAAETFGRVSGNFEYWLAHGLLPLSLYRPDVEALRSGRTRVLVGAGEQSAGETAYRTAVALAAKLRTEVVHFPGDHLGFEPHPQRFADILHGAFSRAEV